MELPTASLEALVSNIAALVEAYECETGQRLARLYLDPDEPAIHALVEGRTDEVCEGFDQSGLGPSGLGQNGHPA